MSKVLIISGAGTGVDSGIKTFRTDTASGAALWDEYDVNDVCNYHKFNLGYKAFKGVEGVELYSEAYGSGNNTNVDIYTLTHDFYNKRREELGGVEPNVFHRAVSELYHKYGSEKVINITTNVDDLLERAGINHDDVLHVHGYLPSIKYKRNGLEFKEEIGYTQVDTNKFEWVKPDVVFFGEMAPLYGWMDEQIGSLKKGDLVIVVGCSNQVIDFNWELFPLLRKGVKLAVVNPDINYLEQQQYDERGVIVWRDTSTNVFSNKNFLDYVESVLNDE